MSRLQKFAKFLTGAGGTCGQNASKREFDEVVPVGLYFAIIK
jgi:hypothetical protein